MLIVISIICTVGVSDKLVGSFVEVVVPTAPDHHRQNCMMLLLHQLYWHPALFRDIQCMYCIAPPLFEHEAFIFRADTNNYPD